MSAKEARRICTSTLTAESQLRKDKCSQLATVTWLRVQVTLHTLAWEAASNLTKEITHKLS